MLKLLERIFPYALVILVIVLFIYIVLLPFIASWKLFEKVGIPGWKSLIPFYNTYLVFKIAGMPGMCFLPIAIAPIFDEVHRSVGLPNWALIIGFILTIIVIIINIIRAIKLSKAFGKGKVFMVGLIIFPEIFEIILGMGKSKYKGPYKVKEKTT